MSIGSRVDEILHTLQSHDINDLLLTIEERLPEKPNASSTLQAEEVENIIHENFIQQCQLFLKDNQRFNQFAKKIERRAEQSLREIEKAEKYMQLRTSVDLQVEVTRIVERSRYNQERQKALQSMCQLLEMPEEYASALREKKDIDTKSIEDDENFSKAVDFILRQKQLIDVLNESTKNIANKPLVKALESSNVQLSSLATAKAVKAVKQLADNEPTLQLIKHYKKLFRVSPESKLLFFESYAAWRTERIKNILWPMVNPLDYSLQQPLQLYYSSVFGELDKLLRIEKSMIEEINAGETQQPSEKFLQKLWPACALPAYNKLERNFLKCADLLSLVTIKRSYHLHIEAIKALFASEEPQAGQAEQTAFEPVILTSSIVKLVVCIEAQLKAETEKLTGNKYNIYSVSSYLIISEHLKMVLECYLINRPYVTDPTSTNTSFLDPFVELANTRLPNETNKSLVLFNLNIWQMFSDIWGEQQHLTDSKGKLLSERCSKTLEECSKMLHSMNLTETKAQLLSNSSGDQKKTLTQLLTICSSDVKKTLHSELSLIIHPKLRLKIRDELNETFLKLYSDELETIPPMDNAQLKAMCTELQVNIKALGKAADTVKVLTVQEMREVLEA